MLTLQRSDWSYAVIETLTFKDRTLVHCAACGFTVPVKGDRIPAHDSNGDRCDNSNRPITKRTIKYFELVKAALETDRPAGHFVPPTANITCCGGTKHRCANPAMWCEYMRWKPNGIAFYYYCEECWILPGPHGDTPKERANKVQT
jgi:hypothetical protein